MASIIIIPSFCDRRGKLAVLEHNCPFTFRIAYWIYRPEGVRGGHRHKKNRQIMFALSGSVKIYVHDGKKAINYLLDSPEKGLLLEPEDWHRMEYFSKDCVLLVFASHPYDVNDYIDEPYPC